MKMRNHFLKCYGEGKLTPFPGDSAKASKPIAIKGVQLHCDCRLPDFVTGRRVNGEL